MKKIKTRRNELVKLHHQQIQKLLVLIINHLVEQIKATINQNQNHLLKMMNNYANF